MPNTIDPHYGSPLPRSPGVEGPDSLRVLGLRADGRRWLPLISHGRASVGGGVLTEIGAPEFSQQVTFVAGLSGYPLALPGGRPTSGLALRPAALSRGGVSLVPLLNSVRWALVANGNCYAGDLLSPAERGDLPADALLWYFPTDGRSIHAVHRSRVPRSLDVLADGDALLRRVRRAQELVSDRVYCEDRGRGLVYGLYASEALPPAPFGSGQWAATYVSLASGPSLLCEEVGYVDTDGLLRLRRAGAYQADLSLIQPDGPIPCTTGMLTGNTVEVLLNGSRLDYGTTVLARYRIQDSFCLAEGASGLTLFADSSSVGTGSLTLFAAQSAVPVDVNPVTSGAKRGFLYAPPPGLGAGPFFDCRSGELGCSTSAPVWDPAYGVGESITVRGRALDASGSPVEGAAFTLAVSGPFSVDSAAKSADRNGEAFWIVTPTGSGAGSLSLFSSGLVLAQQGIRTALGERGASVLICPGEGYSFSGTSGRKIMYVTCVGPDGFPWTGGGTVTLSCVSGSFFDPGGFTGSGLGTSASAPLDAPGPLLCGPGVLRVGYSPVPGDRLTARLVGASGAFDAAPILI